MKTKFFLLLIISFFTCNLMHAQTSLNNYKYVVVPNTFDFLNDPDQYRLNTLTKLLLEKHGFAVIMEDEKLPDDAIHNNCLVLKANVLKEPAFLNTKLQVQLKNCKNEVVYTSRIGKSREKSYQVAYTLALREAFKSFNSFTYKYKKNALFLSSESNKPKTNNTEIEKLKEEIKTLKEEKEIVAEQAKEIQELAVKEDVALEKKPQTSASTNVLFAQKTTNGFQLVDTASTVIYTIKKTGMQYVYLVTNMEAIIYQLDANWILEYYEDEKLQTKILHIKF